MVLIDSVEDFFKELDQMFAFCKDRGAGTVYISLKKVEATSGSSTSSTSSRKRSKSMTNDKKRPAGRKEGWLARAKISKKRKISVLVHETKITPFRAKLASVKQSAEPRHVAGGITKTGRYAGQKSGPRTKAKAGR